jgi:hypothetical protein
MSTPIQIENELKALAQEIDHWDALLAWHEGQRDYYRTKLAVAEARAAMEYTGPATKAKYYAVASTEKQRIDLDVAAAQMGVCTRRIHALDKTLLTVMGRNKSATNAYNMGGY